MTTSTMNIDTKPAPQRVKETHTHVDTTRCAGCKFRVDDWCQRYPPQLFLTNGQVKGHWPAVEMNDWCGEWRAK